MSQIKHRKRKKKKKEAAENPKFYQIQKSKNENLIQWNLTQPRERERERDQTLDRDEEDGPKKKSRI
jgi:protein-tyrosine phosphatase